MKEKMVYFFGQGCAEGNKDMRDILGGKGANLAEMTNLGIPVPPGFTISTKACVYFFKHSQRYPEGLKEEVKEAISRVEEIMGLKFGHPSSPLLLSVRSGAPVSMPGMMDTVLNLGLNPQTTEALARKTRNPRFAKDCYRRFIMMFANVVQGMKRDEFEKILSFYKSQRKIKYEYELLEQDLDEIIEEYKNLVKRETGYFPDDPWEQLWKAIDAVFKSWNNDRAIAYRELNNISHEMGTGVNIQAMVFGNMGEDGATGVAFTRNPSTGEKYLYGEWLPNAQGEDVVAGVRTPFKILKREQGENSLEQRFPECFKELLKIQAQLESHYKDLQDIEFTIEGKKLWVLQTRSGARTGAAALQIAVDMVQEGLIQEKEALLRVTPTQLSQVLQTSFDLEEKNKAILERRVLGKGLAAGPGAASAKIVFTAKDAQQMVAEGEKVILVREETSPDDIRGMAVADGILTARGGMTSHAALVARQMGKVCVVGCETLKIFYEKNMMIAKDQELKKGDFISIDGTSGEVIQGKITTVEPEILEILLGKRMPTPLFEKFQLFLKWADKERRLKIRTNADQRDQAQKAIAFGAEGIGLCRTEHMFFGEGKIEWMQEMILALDQKGREKALKGLLPLQRKDFELLFEVMDGRPVTIRTLDPPLHEFLPDQEDKIESLASKMKISKERLKNKIASLKELNPMLGHRGCRLGIVYPEITRMQARAIFEAAVNVKKKGKEVNPEIMIPLVGEAKELALQGKIVREVAEEVFKKSGIRVPYLIGTMIELPRACLTADELAKEADFFSFGTNDLTQTTYGLSRDDARGFFFHYHKEGIFTEDPFQTIDQKGVGLLMEITVKKAHQTNRDIKIGICGEHGGDPASIEFCHRLGLDYVSCSPFRVPGARLAAAQAALKKK
jgi:pyruvate,orthophosphate dikinase